MRQTRRNGLGLGFLTAVFMAVALAAAMPTRAEEITKGQFSLPTEKIQIVTGFGKTYDFTVEMANDDKERAIGLMFRKYLPTNWGMLFDFKEPRRISMWMKNTFIPLDIFFVADDGIITKIHRNAKPHDLTSISSLGRALVVLEFKAGMANRMGIAEGDKVIHPIFKRAAQSQ